MSTQNSTPTQTLLQIAAMFEIAPGLDIIEELKKFIEEGKRLETENAEARRISFNELFPDNTLPEHIQCLVNNVNLYKKWNDDMEGEFKEILFQLGIKERCNIVPEIKRIIDNVESFRRTSDSLGKTLGEIKTLLGEPTNESLINSIEELKASNHSRLLLLSRIRMVSGCNQETTIVQHIEQMRVDIELGAPIKKEVELLEARLTETNRVLNESNDLLDELRREAGTPKHGSILESVRILVRMSQPLKDQLHKINASLNIGVDNHFEMTLTAIETLKSSKAQLNAQLDEQKEQFRTIYKALGWQIDSDSASIAKEILDRGEEKKILLMKLDDAEKRLSDSREQKHAIEAMGAINTALKINLSANQQERLQAILNLTASNDNRGYALEISQREGKRLNFELMLKDEATHAERLTAIQKLIKHRDELQNLLDQERSFINTYRIADRDLNQEMGLGPDSNKDHRIAWVQGAARYMREADKRGKALNNLLKVPNKSHEDRLEAIVKLMNQRDAFKATFDRLLIELGIEHTPTVEAALKAIRTLRRGGDYYENQIVIMYSKRDEKIATYAYTPNDPNLASEIGKVITIIKANTSS